MGARAARQQLLQWLLGKRAAAGDTRVAISGGIQLLKKYRLWFRFLEHAGQSAAKPAHQHVLELGPNEGTLATGREAQLCHELRVRSSSNRTCGTHWSSRERLATERRSDVERRHTIYGHRHQYGADQRDAKGFEYAESDNQGQEFQGNRITTNPVPRRILQPVESSEFSHTHRGTVQHQRNAQR